MGSGNSRMGSRSSRPRTINQTRSRSKLSFLLCGSSSSHASVEMEESLVNSAPQSNQANIEVHPIDGSSSISGSGTGLTSSITETEPSSENSSAISEDTSEIKELVFPHQVNVDNSQDESSYRDRSSATASTSYQSSDPSENRVVDIDSGVPRASDPSPSASLLLETRPSGLGDVLHVDVVSITDTSNGEARRNSRRLFRDAFSRRSSRRVGDSPTIIFSTDDTNDMGSHDRWLLDFSGDFFDDGVGSDFSRIHSLNRRRHHSRSEIWERLRQTTNCPSGLHPDGTCSFELLLMNEESSTHASISRIVMLAEALFEVLDEIHRQPMSLALSMVSLPAPESVVDSFPLKNHKKSDPTEAGHDVEQCYICLAEYEEGEKIRVLPCKHEYHMSCVDKWLKEIHGVCPLCRGDVRDGDNDATQCSVSNSELPSI